VAGNPAKKAYWGRTILTEPTTAKPGDVPGNRGVRDLAVLLLVGAVFFLFRLGSPGLMDPDEGRYAEIAREMLLLKDWLIPHLNLLPYLEKPPLVYWLTALSFQVLGLSEWAARLPSALCALGGVILAYGLGRTFWGPAAGLLSALVLATCGGYVVMGRLLTLDMALTFFLNLGVGLGYLALSRERPRLWPWAYLALALGVLTKGPVALVLAAVIWTAGAWSQGRPLFRSWLHPWSLALLAAVSFPWFMGVTVRYPDFWRFFILEQHLGRYLTASIHHQHSYFYYLPILLGFLLPWTWLLPWALGREKPWKDPDRLFLLIWAATILLFFTLSRGKLAPYILPALLPLALLVGHSLGDLAGGGRRVTESRGLLLTLGLWTLLGWGAVVLYLWPPAFLTPLMTQTALVAPCVLLGVFVLALTPTLALIWPRAGVLLVGAFFLGVLVFWGMEKVSVQRSPRAMGLILKSRWQPGAGLVGYRLYSQGLSFYSGQIFHLLEFSTELDYGRKLAPDNPLFFRTPGEMAAWAQSRPLVFFFLKKDNLGPLKQELPGKFHFLAGYKNSILLEYNGASLPAGDHAGKRLIPASPLLSAGN
jgi:4-amino-4-deoxy-L-arabinose transferase-like glycosyltransferase